MAENKTKPTAVNVDDFIQAVEHPVRRADAELLVQWMREVTGVEPKMWGPSMIGFGSYNYTYDSGHSGTFLRIGFSPRKSNLSLYLSLCGKPKPGQLATLGKYKTGAACLYVNKLADVDTTVLRKMIDDAWHESFERYPN